MTILEISKVNKMSQIFPFSSDPGPKVKYTGKSLMYYSQFIVPRFRESVGTLNFIRPSVCPSFCLSQKL